MAFWTRKSEQRSLPPTANALPLLGAYSATTISPSAALRIGDVWSAVRLLADSVSSLPLHVFRKTDGGRARVDSGSLYDLLQDPGPGTTQADLVSTLMSHLLLYGNGYVAKYREADVITQLGLLDPERIRPELQSGQLRFRYTPSTGGQRLLTESDLVHVKGLSTDGLTGLSAVSQAARVLGLSDELVKHAVSYFEVGAVRPAGVLRMGPDASFGDADRTTEKLKAEARPHGLLVIQGDAEYHEIAAKMDDSQFVEQRRLAAQEIARVFRIPPNMLGAGSGGDSLTYATVEQQSIDFVRYSLTPWLRRIELALSGDRDLTSDRQFLKFEVDGLLRADAATRSEVYTRGLDPITGWLDVDEVRALEDLPPRVRAHALVTPATNGSGTPENVPIPQEAA